MTITVTVKRMSCGGPSFSVLSLRYCFDTGSDYCQLAHGTWSTIQFGGDTWPGPVPTDKPNSSGKQNWKLVKVICIRFLIQDEMCLTTSRGYITVVRVVRGNVKGRAVVLLEVKVITDVHEPRISNSSRSDWSTLKFSMYV